MLEPLTATAVCCRAAMDQEWALSLDWLACQPQMKLALLSTLLGSRNPWPRIAVLCEEAKAELLLLANLALQELATKRLEMAVEIKSEIS